MAASTRSFFVDCLRVLLTPAVHFALRHSIHVQEVIELVKVTFLQIAQKEAGKSQNKVNISRLSAITGLHRRDVIRLYRHQEQNLEPRSLVSRVLGQWQHDPRFSTSAGKPKVLSLDGDKCEFHQLVRSVSTDLHPGTVLFELDRLGAIEYRRRGICLVSQVYIPKDDLKQGLSLLAADIGDISEAVLSNLLTTGPLPNLHAKTEYDNVHPDAIPTIRKWLLRTGAQFHQKVRRFLAKYDQDITPSKTFHSPGIRVAIGTFSIIDEKGKTNAEQESHAEVRAEVANEKK